eukprot:4594155-Pyramimonas_sp.AAC.1
MKKAKASHGTIPEDWWNEKLLTARVTHAISGNKRAYITGTTSSKVKPSLIVELTQKHHKDYHNIVLKWAKKIEKTSVTKQQVRQWKEKLLGS